MRKSASFVCLVKSPDISNSFRSVNSSAQICLARLCARGWHMQDSDALQSSATSPCPEVPSRLTPTPSLNRHHTAGDDCRDRLLDSHSAGNQPVDVLKEEMESSIVGQSAESVPIPWLTWHPARIWLIFGARPMRGAWGSGFSALRVGIAAHLTFSGFGPTPL